MTTNRQSKFPKLNKKDVPNPTPPTADCASCSRTTYQQSQGQRDWNNQQCSPILQIWISWEAARVPAQAQAEQHFPEAESDTDYTRLVDWEVDPSDRGRVGP